MIVSMIWTVKPAEKLAILNAVELDTDTGQRHLHPVMTFHYKMFTSMVEYFEEDLHKVLKMILLATHLEGEGASVKSIVHELRERSRTGNYEFELPAKVGSAWLGAAGQVDAWDDDWKFLEGFNGQDGGVLDQVGEQPEQRESRQVYNQWEDNVPKSKDSDDDGAPKSTG